MTGYLVDTNIPSELTREQADARVSAFIKRTGKENLFLSVMTLGEICKGINLLEHDLTLVTRNVKDYGGLGVTLKNPWI